MVRSARHSKTRYWTPPFSATSTAGSMRSPEKPAPAPMRTVRMAPSSIRLDVGRAHQLAPLGDVALEEAAELRRRHAHRLQPLLNELRPQLRVGEGLRQRAVDAVEYGLRQTGRREQAVPSGEDRKSTRLNSSHANI